MNNNLIGESKIKVKNYEDDIMKLPLPDEVNNKILEYTGIEYKLKDEHHDDKFWVNLGEEHCNLKSMNSDIYNIMCCSHGKSHEISGFIFKESLWSILSSALDNQINSCYHMIFNRIIIKHEDYKEKTDIVSVFYSTDTRTKYPVYVYDYASHKRTINSFEMNLINIFLERMYNYLTYLKINIDNMPEYVTHVGILRERDRKESLMKIINKFQSWVLKMKEMKKKIVVKERI